MSTTETEPDHSQSIRIDHRLLSQKRQRRSGIGNLLEWY
jgi:hypothetical protein